MNYGLTLICTWSTFPMPSKVNYLLKWFQATTQAEIAVLINCPEAFILLQLLVCEYVCIFLFLLFENRKLRLQLQQLRWEGSKSKSHEHPERSCARCRKALGVLMNRGAVCNGCSHRVCSGCRIILNPYVWKCTVCYAHE